METIGIFPQTLVRRLTLAVAAMAMLLWAGASFAVPPDEAVKKLKEGNARFVSRTATHPRTSLDRVVETSTAQFPFATVLTCSDSRLSPEIIFDLDIGDLFVVRDAGNVIDPVVTGSVEYAVAHLKTNVVVVMGHTHCGAVGAAVSGGHAEGSIGEIVHEIEPSVKKVKESKPTLAGEQLVDAVAQANVRHSISDLLTRSALLREAVKKGSLRILGAVYNVSTGRVQWLSQPPGSAKLAP
jgi:carbonic anhydrase